MNIKAITYLVAVLICAGCVCGFAISAGSNATQASTNLEETYEDNKLKDDTVASEAMPLDSEPVVMQVSYVTTREVDSEETTEDPEPTEIYLGEFRLTAYCSCEQCCGQYALNRPKDENGNDIVYGASGRVVYPNHSIAVDPSVIPYGSHVLINGHEYEAADCGGGIKGNRIDVYFASHQDACEFGVQYADVYLIKE